MLGLFKRKHSNLLRLPVVVLVRSHTRALIRSANMAESAGLNEAVPRDGVTEKGEEWQSVMSGEARLATSIAAAVSEKVSIRAIVEDVIKPVLQDATIVSQTAHASVRRAIGTANRN